MNILTEEYEKDERVTSLYNVLIPFAQFHQNYDEEVEKKIEELKFLYNVRMPIIQMYELKVMWILLLFKKMFFIRNIEKE